MKKVHVLASLILILTLLLSMGESRAAASLPTGEEYPSRPLYGSAALHAALQLFSQAEAPVEQTQHVLPSTFQADAESIVTCIIYESFRDNNWDLYLSATTLTGQGEIFAYKHPAVDVQPRLTRGCARVVFISDRTGSFQIFRMNLDGSDLRQLTSQGQNFSPAWSPDGSKIVFESERDGQSDVYVMNADGSNPVRLTSDPDFDGQPTWSPDGKQIAFVSRRTGGYRIWIMNADGSSPRQVSYVPYSAHPAWSHDGRQIAFDADAEDDLFQEAWLVNVDGSGHFPLYDPGSNADAFVSGWSASKREVTATLVGWIYSEDTWYWTGTSTRRIADNGSYMEALTPDFRDWNPDERAVDITPPTTILEKLPALSPSPVPIRWHCQTTDGCGMGIEFKLSADSPWLPWNDNFYPIPAPDGTYTAGFPGQGGITYSFRLRGVDAYWNYTGYYFLTTTVEGLPPETAILPDLIYTRTGQNALVGWDGTDPGGSGIINFKIQYRDADGLDWLDWHTSPDPGTKDFSGFDGHTYYLRVSGEDQAQNVEPWAEGSGDGQVSFYTWMASGKVIANTGNPVSGAMPAISPGGIPSPLSSLTGKYAAYAASMSTYSLSVSKGGYGSSGNYLFPAGADAQIDVILPPADDILLDGSFESADPLAGPWSASGNPLPIITATVGTSGESMVFLGQKEGFQTLFSSAVNDMLNGNQKLLVDGDGSTHLFWVIPFDGIYYASCSPGGTCSPPERLVDMGGTVQVEGSQWDAALDGQGGVHLVWFQAQDHITAHRSKPSGGGWTAPRTIHANPTGTDSYLKLLVDKNESAVLFWQIWDGSQRYLAYAYDTGATWSAPLNLAQFTQVTWTAPFAAALSPTGEIHFIRADNRSGQDSLLYHHLRSATGVWTAPVQIGSSGSAYTQLQIFADQAGGLHLTWAPEWQNTILYRQRTAAGSWSSPLTAAENTQGSYQSAGTPGGKLCLGWTANADGQDLAVYSRCRSAAGTWSAVQQATLPTTYWVITHLVFDSQEKLHALVMNSNDSFTAVYYLYGGLEQEWELPVLVPENASHTLATGLRIDQTGMVHAAWYNYDAGGIFYGRRRISAADSISAISQVVSLPASMQHPILSFMSKIQGSDPANATAFRILAEDSQGVYPLATLQNNENAWMHHKIPMDSWAGKTITLTLAVEQSAGTSLISAALDDISLGSSCPDAWLGMESNRPQAVTNQSVIFTLTYGNLSSTAAQNGEITLTLPAGVNFVSASQAPSLVNGSQVVWEALLLEPESGIHTLVVETVVTALAPSFKALTSQAAISVNEVELETANNSASASFFTSTQLYLPMIQR